MVAVDCALDHPLEHMKLYSSNSMASVHRCDLTSTGFQNGDSDFWGGLASISVLIWLTS